MFSPPPQVRFSSILFGYLATGDIAAMAKGSGGGGGLGRRIRQFLTPSCLNLANGKLPEGEAACESTADTADQYPIPPSPDASRWRTAVGSDIYNCSTVRVNLTDADSQYDGGMECSIGSRRESVLASEKRDREAIDHSRSCLCACLEDRQFVPVQDDSPYCDHYLVLGYMKPLHNNLLLYQPNKSELKHLCPNYAPNSCCRARLIRSSHIDTCAGMCRVGSVDKSDCGSGLAQLTEAIIGHEADRVGRKTRPSGLSEPVADSLAGDRQSASQRVEGWLFNRIQCGIATGDSKELHNNNHTPNTRGNVRRLSPEKNILQCDSKFSYFDDESITGGSSISSLFAQKSSSQKSTTFMGKSGSSPSFAVNGVGGFTDRKYEVWDDDFEIPHEDQLDVPSSLYGRQNRVLSNSANLKRFATITNNINKSLIELESLSSILLLKNPLAHCRIIEKYSDVITDSIKIVSMESLPFDIPLKPRTCTGHTPHKHSEDNFNSPAIDASPSSHYAPSIQQKFTPRQPSPHQKLFAFTGNAAKHPREPHLQPRSTPLGPSSRLRNTSTKDGSSRAESSPVYSSPLQQKGKFRRKIDHLSLSVDAPPPSIRNCSAGCVSKPEDVLASLVAFASKLGKLLSACLLEITSTLASPPSSQQHLSKNAWTHPGECAFPVPAP